MADEAQMSTATVGRGIEIITPAVRPQERFPVWIWPIPVIAAGLSLAAHYSDATVLHAAHGIGLAAAALAGCALASWLAQRLAETLARRSPVVGLAAAAMAPLVGLVLGSLIAGLIENALDSINIDGVALSMLFIGTLWFVGASIGNFSVHAIDVGVSAVVSRFRTRIILAILLLLALVGALVLGIGRIAYGIVDTLANNPGTIELDLGTGDSKQTARELSAWVADNQDLAYATFLLLAVLFVLPAITAASGALADAVMERIHPLVYAFDAVAAGARNVHLEEAGSADFIEVSRHFNQMVDGLRISERMERAFGTYVSPQVLGRIREQHGEAVIPPSVREASVFFADIRGFTTLSERLTPAAIVALLNRYFERVVDVISKHEGYLNKFIGDAVVVVFNGPIDQPDHALRVTRCAIEIIETVREMNAAGEFEEIDGLRIGIGIATGNMVCGNVGSARQMEYTVIGDTVNLASRVEGMTKLYGASILITEGTEAALANEIETREVDRVAAKGKSEAVTLYEVLDGLPDAERAAKLASRDGFAQARRLFAAGDMAGARTGFVDCARSNPSDGAARRGVELCDRFIAEGLPEDWDGVMRLTSK